MITLEWMKCLLEKMSRKGVARLLDYYLGIRWLDDDLYSRALSMLYGVESPLETESIDDWRLSIEEHVRSLFFISAIKGKEMNRNKIRALLFKAENLWKEGELGI